MSQDALRDLRTLLSFLNQPQVNSEVNRLFRSTGNSSATNTTATNTAATNTAATNTAATNTATTNTATNARTTTNTVNSVLRNIGPLFSPQTAATRGRGRGRGRGRTTPYPTPGHVFTRLVVLLSGPDAEEVPRGRQRQHIRDVQREARVSFRSGMTPPEVRTSILHGFQAQGHLRNITDCSQFDFLNCDEANKRKLIQLDPQEQNPTGTSLKTIWRSQCPIYIRPHFQLPNVTPAITPTTTASPGYIFRQNIQSLLQCLSSHATSTTTTNTNTSTTTIDTTQNTANTGTTHTGTTHTTNTSTTTIGTTQTTTSTGTTYTHTGTTHTINTSTTTIGTTQTSTNTGAAYTHTSTTHTTNTHTTTTGTMYTHTGTTPATNTGTAQTIQVVNASATAPSTSTTIAVPAIIGDDDDDRDLLSPAWDVNTHDRLQDVSLPESILLSSPIGSPGSPFSVMSLSPENRSSDGQETADNDVMDGSRVAIQVSEDMVALPASVTVQGLEVGEIIPCRIQRSSQVLSAFTGVQPEMFYAWQNEIYGWQHPNIITMPYELLHYQASQDLIPMIVYFSSNPAYDIHRDDFCRNILSDPDFIQACSNVYFWCIGDCPESTEIQRSLHVQQHAPLLVSVIHNASGAQMTPVVLTDFKLTSVQEVVAFIQTAVGVQQDQVQLRRSRELRTAQDAEYQASLEQDRARARQREEERAREEEIERERLIAEAQQRDQEERNREEEMERERLNVEANENAIREARAQLPAEPLESSDTVTIRLRGPRDQSVQRTFFHRDTTEVLYRAAFALLELPSQEFRLRLHAVIIENNGATLAEHGLGTTNSILLSVDM